MKNCCTHLHTSVGTLQMSPSAGPASGSEVHGRGECDCVTVSIPTPTGGVPLPFSGGCPPRSPSTYKGLGSSAGSRSGHLRRFLGLYTCVTGFTYGEVCNIDGCRVRGSFLTASQLVTYSPLPLADVLYSCLLPVTPMPPQYHWRSFE